MKFTLPEGTHCIDAAEMLKFYAKPEESELLIPPFLKLEFAETAISETEIKITDCNGNSPEISVNASVSGLADSFGTASELSKDGNVAGMRVYTALNNGIQPDISDIELYSLWKKALQLKLYELLDEFI